MRIFVCSFVVCVGLLSVAQRLAAALNSPSVPVVTVLLDYEQPYSRSSFEALGRQLQHILNDAGLKIDLRDRKQAHEHEEFSGLLVFQMKGQCTMDPLPIGALSDERGPLAMAYSADGTILPFGEVQCDHVRQSIQRLVGRGNPKLYQSAFGSALGLVIAHEVYHMLAHSPLHTSEGVTKHSLSARELLEGRLSLPRSATLAMHAQTTSSK